MASLGHKNVDERLFHWQHIIEDYRPDLETFLDIYRSIHEHPELSGFESNTARLVTQCLEGFIGLEVTPAVGGHGVVAVLKNGPGKAILLRTELDAQPIEEETGLSYASKHRIRNFNGQERPVMHARGHDIHIGAKAMVDGGLYDICPKPDIMLVQNLTAAKAGSVVLKAAVVSVASYFINIHLSSDGIASNPDKYSELAALSSSFTIRILNIEIDDEANVRMIVHGKKRGATNDVNLVLEIQTSDPEIQLKVLDSVKAAIDDEVGLFNGDN